jgi:hypothetical protein
VIPAVLGWKLTGAGLVLVAVCAGIAWLWRQRPRLLVVRDAQSPRTVLPARLIPSPRAIAGRPSAASTARPVYTITDAPWRNPAPGRTERKS